MKMFSEHVIKKLSAYCNGELADTESRRVAAHLLKCHRCRKEYDAIHLGVRLAEQLPQGSAPAGKLPQGECARRNVERNRSPARRAKPPPCNADPRRRLVSQSQGMAM